MSAPLFTPEDWQAIGEAVASDKLAYLKSVVIAATPKKPGRPASRDQAGLSPLDRERATVVLRYRQGLISKEDAVALIKATGSPQNAERILYGDYPRIANAVAVLEVENRPHKK